MLHHPELGDVPEGVWMPIVRCAAPHTKDEIEIYVTRYKWEKGDDGRDTYEQEYMRPDTTWVKYDPYATIEPFFSIPGYKMWRMDPLQTMAERLGPMLANAIYKEIIH